VTRDLGKEWEDSDGFFADFSEELIASTQSALPGCIMERSSLGSLVSFKASAESSKPSCILRIDKASGVIDHRDFSSQWKLSYKIHKDPLRLEAWAEWTNVPGYHHPKLVAEKQGFVDALLKSIHPDLKHSSVVVREDYSPLRPWASCIVSDPLDAFGEFDVLWDKLLELLRHPMKSSDVKVQNVTTNGFTVFSKGVGNRSSWGWTKYRYDKYKMEERPEVIGPSVELGVGEVTAEHYSSWREMKFRSHIVLNRRPLQLEFWGETVSGSGRRIKEPYPVLHFGLLTVFGKLYAKRDLALSQTAGTQVDAAAAGGGPCSRCRRRRTPAFAGGKPTAGHKEKDS